MRITREQVVAACEALGLDANYVSSLYITTHRVAVAHWRHVDDREPYLVEFECPVEEAE